MTPAVNQIYQGDCIEVMKTWPANFVDTIITDPPYGIGFMGKAWDSFEPEFIETKQGRYREGMAGPVIGARGEKAGRCDSPAQSAGSYDQTLKGHRDFQSWCCAWATEALRIAKPGAMMLVSGGTRTFHRMTAGLEDAGWQIRDCLMWLYGSGFPKSLDISKAIDKAKGAEREVIGQRTTDLGTGNGSTPIMGDSDNHDITAPATSLARLWSGYGTALKPAWEPIIVAMKPLDGTFAHNAETWGVAGINVDGGRVETDWVNDPNKRGYQGNNYVGGSPFAKDRHDEALKIKREMPTKGRWPANLILDEEAAAMLDGATHGQIHSAGAERQKIVESHYQATSLDMSGARQMNRLGDSGGASRFFYVAKSCRAERNEGCEEMPQKETHRYGAGIGEGKHPEAPVVEKNNHPTVKPLSLMKYLCMLTKTPTGGIVLDPFAGSGTTLWAAEFHNRPWIGIEMNSEYVAIANARIARERSQMKMAI